MERKSIPNRLIKEKSPYLLQHAYNPVQWYPWGEEAFMRARQEDKPVFLSIGYSTCHWCHVMGRESFENREVAAILNRGYIAVKVDREERPDIDAVYMAVCQAMTGQGGWPLTIVMAPDGKPFFAATYLPARAKWGMYGLVELLPFLLQEWKNNRGALSENGERLLQALRDAGEESCCGEPSMALAHRAYQTYCETFDTQNGGFGGAPKFPVPHQLLFLLRYAQMNQDAVQAVPMAEKTLTQMYRGGLFDHLGGGFSRYATDRRWLIPHFEKMLYDNALLSYVYLEAHQITGKEEYLEAAQKTLDYLLRELKSEDGGFYCGQDADSGGTEGGFYVFTQEEIMEQLGEENGKLFCDFFGITRQGNFEGKNILNLLSHHRDRRTAEELAPLIHQMYRYRAARMPLHKDDKILCAWNGLAIAALAKAYIVTQDKSYLNAAVRAQAFLDARLSDGRRLFIRYRDGETAGEGILDDYAFAVFGLLELYQAGFQAEYLEKAVFWAQTMTELFADQQQGGLYLYARDARPLILRPKETYDGALPSGNSVAAYVYERLARITGEPMWEDLLNRQMEFLAGEIQSYPAGSSFALLALLHVMAPAKKLVCLYPEEAQMKELRILAAQFPDLAVLVLTGENREEILRAAPMAKEYFRDTAQPRFYYCQGNHCHPPVSHPEEIRQWLEPDRLAGKGCLQ